MLPLLRHAHILAYLALWSHIYRGADAAAVVDGVASGRGRVKDDSHEVLRTPSALRGGSLMGGNFPNYDDAKLAAEERLEEEEEMELEDERLLRNGAYYGGYSPIEEDNLKEEEVVEEEAPQEPEPIMATDAPSYYPTPAPTPDPTLAPSPEPTPEPSLAPTDAPTRRPSRWPTRHFTPRPTSVPTVAPTMAFMGMFSSEIEAVKNSMALSLSIVVIACIIVAYILVKTLNCVACVLSTIKRAICACLCCCCTSSEESTDYIDRSDRVSRPKLSSSGATYSSSSSNSNAPMAVEMTTSRIPAPPAAEPPAKTAAQRMEERWSAPKSRLTFGGLDVPDAMDDSSAHSSHPLTQGYSTSRRGAAYDDA